jgi:hypothetical protein
MVALDDGGRIADGGGGFARLRLDQQVVGGQIGQLSGHGGAVLDPGDHVDMVGADGGQQPSPRPLQQGAPLAGQVVQEFRRVGPGQRPEPGADASGGDDGIEARAIEA